MMQTSPEVLRAQVETGLANGEFETHYQPKFDPDSEDIVGVEALLRWRHPDEGFCEAGRFLPVVEDDGALMAKLDGWVLRNTTCQAQAWRDLDDDFGFLNVNLSSWGRGEAVVAMVEDALNASGYPAASLALECPWRMFATDTDAIVSTMRALQGLGCHIVLDGGPLDEDSLQAVRQTPVQWAKVCIEYLQELAETENTAVLKRSIKQWHRRGIEVIAMGVESEQQLVLAHHAGCRYAQGQRFKSALPADEIGYLLKMVAQTKKALSLI